MKALQQILMEIWGLFVDDGSLALALLVWCGSCGLGLTRLPIAPEWDAAVLFLGCVAILIVNVVKTGRSKSAR